MNYYVSLALTVFQRYGMILSNVVQEFRNDALCIAYNLQKGDFNEN